MSIERDNIDPIMEWVNKKILCKKCKIPMRDVTCESMGPDKRCDKCGKLWHHVMGYNPRFGRFDDEMDKR